MSKHIARCRRARKTRVKIKKLGIPRLCTHRSLNHIYAQLISPDGDKVLASVSSTEKVVRSKHKHCGNKAAAAMVGELIAQRALKVGIKKVAFDRSGNKYHGRISALAEAARVGGLDF